jgi:hypothetical protein
METAAMRERPSSTKTRMTGNLRVARVTVV